MRAFFMLYSKKYFFLGGSYERICSRLYKIKKTNPKNIFNSNVPKTNANNNFEIVVAHVNHMIREEASEDEEFVKNYCKKIGVEFYSKSIDVKKLPIIIK